MSETAVPSTLNEQLFKRALQCCHNFSNTCTWQLKACDIQPALASGENFCSTIYQVYVEYEVNGNAQSKAFIVKVMIPEIAEIGSNEEVMYNTVLPGMEKCLNFVEGDNANKLHAKCLLSEHDNQELYVMENLNSLGYHCANRTIGLDLQHATVLMEKIAKFHAASMIYAKKFPDVVKSLRGSHFQNGASDVVSQAIAFDGFKYVAKMIANWPANKNLSQEVLSLTAKFNSLVMAVTDATMSKFNVINHGDLWVNNFLYKCDEVTKQPVDVLFVDFQNCFWGSCGFDINWYLNTSLELKVLKDKRRQLICSYYEVLKSTLSKENYALKEIPTIEDVLWEVKRCEIIGLYCSFCELPIVALGKSEGFDCNTFTQPEKMDKIRVLMYENPRVKEALEYTLKYFEEINIL